VKYPNALILAGLLPAGPALADSSPASDESVRRLLELTDPHKLIDAAKTQVNPMVTSALRRAHARQACSAKYRQIQLETVRELKDAPSS
jgi:hypothetical protein